MWLNFPKIGLKSYELLAVLFFIVFTEYHIFDLGFSMENKFGSLY